MEQWIQQVLSGDHIGFAFYPAVFSLGVLGAFTSCCTLPVIGAVIAYAGVRETHRGLKEIFLLGLFFAIGTTITLAVVGALIGLVSHAANASVGRYWQLASGLIIVFFGLVGLNLVRIRTPKLNVAQSAWAEGPLGAVTYGAALGGATTACSIGCNPLLPMAISMALLNGSVVSGALTMTVFAIGFSLPLAVGLVGLRFGLSHLTASGQKFMPYVRAGASVLLLAVGFYLLATV